MIVHSGIGSSLHARCNAWLTYYLSMREVYFLTMTFNVILEDNWTNKLTFATVEDCKDMDDLIDHIHAEFPSHTIEQIKEVN